MYSQNHIVQPEINIYQTKQGTKYQMNWGDSSKMPRTQGRLGDNESGLQKGDAADHDDIVVRVK